jgi:hypothetical protein
MPLTPTATASEWLGKLQKRPGISRPAEVLVFRSLRSGQRVAYPGVTFCASVTGPMARVIRLTALRPLTSALRPPPSDLRLLASDLRPPTSDLRQVAPERPAAARPR